MYLSLPTVNLLYSYCFNFLSTLTHPTLKLSSPLLFICSLSISLLTPPVLSFDHFHLIFISILDTVRVITTRGGSRGEHPWCTPPLIFAETGVPPPLFLQSLTVCWCPGTTAFLLTKVFAPPLLKISRSSPGHCYRNKCLHSKILIRSTSTPLFFPFIDY